MFLNDRGLLNVVNELPVDDYLRGVVPREMGPAIFDEIEALKAQAVAARTYTIRNLGGFTAEGFDICATPRCQVYGGMSVEHPLSDRAVAETSGGGGVSRRRARRDPLQRHLRRPHRERRSRLPGETR